jgi:hypothetical protein
MELPSKLELAGEPQSSNIDYGVSILLQTVIPLLLSLAETTRNPSRRASPLPSSPTRLRLLRANPRVAMASPPPEEQLPIASGGTAVHDLAAHGDGYASDFTDPPPDLGGPAMNNIESCYASEIVSTHEVMDDDEHDAEYYCAAIEGIPDEEIDESDEDIDEYVDPNTTIPEWCPLRPLPERWEGELQNTHTLSVYSQGMRDGFNMCLEEITE